MDRSDRLRCGFHPARRRPRGLQRGPRVLRLPDADLICKRLDGGQFSTYFLQGRIDKLRSLRAPAFAAQRCRPFWRKNTPKNIGSWDIFRRCSLTSHSSTVLTTSAPASKPDRPTTAARLNFNCNPCRSDVLSLRRPYMKNRADL